MPHFILDCSETLLDQNTPDSIMQAVYDAAESTELFAPGDIKVRINPFQLYNIGNSKDDFIHVFGNIMEGRTGEQKSKISNKIVSELKSMFPSVPIISMNIRDFDKDSYCNKQMV